MEQKDKKWITTAASKITQLHIICVISLCEKQD